MTGALVATQATLDCTHSENRVKRTDLQDAIQVGSRLAAPGLPRLNRLATQGNAGRHALTATGRPSRGIAPRPLGPCAADAGSGNPAHPCDQPYPRDQR